MEQTLGKRISYHRKRLGLTQDQLAEQLGVTAQAVSKWENDLSCPDIAMLPKLASLFGISIDALLSGESEPTVHEGEVVEECNETDGIHFQKGPWEFKMSSSRKGALGFALMVLLTGAQLLAARFMDVELSFWSALWPTALMAYGITEMLGKFSFFTLGCTCFGAYFALDNWNLLPFSLGSKMVFPIILVLFGVSLLVEALRKPRKRRFQLKHNNSPKNQVQYHENGFEYNASFGEHTQHIRLEKLTSGTISTSFGEYTVDLSGVDTVSKSCTLEANCSFGELSLLIPSRFRVQCDSNASFASVDIHGQPDAEPIGTILLHASASFGEIEVHYI